MVVTGRVDSSSRRRDGEGASDGEGEDADEDGGGDDSDSDVGATGGLARSSTAISSPPPTSAPPATSASSSLISSIESSVELSVESPVESPLRLLARARPDLPAVLLAYFLSVFRRSSAAAAFAFAFPAVSLTADTSRIATSLLLDRSASRSAVALSYPWRDMGPTIRGKSTTEISRETARHAIAK